MMTWDKVIRKSPRKSITPNILYVSPPPPAAPRRRPSRVRRPPLWPRRPYRQPPLSSWRSFPLPFVPVGQAFFPYRSFEGVLVALASTLWPENRRSNALPSSSNASALASGRAPLPPRLALRGRSVCPPVRLDPKRFDLALNRKW